MTASGRLVFWFGISVFFHGSFSVVGKNCTEANIAVNQEFDLNKFYGEWFSYLGLNVGVVPLEDISHTYQPDGRGGTDVFVRERIPDRECSYTKLKLTAGRSGQLAQVSASGESAPFWVVSTDYTSYAVVSGCDEVGSNGHCTGQAVRSSVWVRQIHHPLPENVLSQIKTAILSVCTEYKDYSPVKHNEQGCRQCKPDQWTVQPNFSIDRFLGLWYVILSVPVTGSDWLEEQHVYSREGNQISLKFKGSSTDKRGSGECRQLTGASLNMTAVPGQMLLIRDGDRTEHDYRVVSVDYQRTAFVIGCDGVISGTGECAVHISWVLSRDKLLSGGDALWMSRIMQQYCIPANQFTAAEQECSGVASRVMSLGTTWSVAFLWTYRLLHEITNT